MQQDAQWGESLSLKSGPKYKALVGSLSRAIAAGVLAPGDRLPPVRQLAWKLGITPGTVARAYTILTEQGVLEAAVGRGTFVAPPKTPVQDDIWARPSDGPEAETINLFSPTLPDVGQVAAIRAALHGAAEASADDLLAYPTRDGYLPAREAALQWIKSPSLGPATSEDLVLSHGGQNAIMLIFQTLLRGQRPVVLVEELSYAGFRRAAELLRVEVVGVPSDANGVIPEALEAAARKHDAQIFCTSPEVHNPTSLWTPLERRKAIVAVCARCNVDIIDDDCYRMGAALAPSYRALYPGRGWYVSSLSKIYTPSLRVGFALAPQGRGPEVRRAAEYGFYGLARPLVDVMQAILTDPKAPVYTQDIRDHMGRYQRIAVNALGGFELHWQRDVPFLWLNLPSGWRAAAFCRAAEGQGVQIRSADEFALRDGRAPHAVRIAINGLVSEPEFEAAMMRLRQLLDNPPEIIAV